MVGDVPLIDLAAQQARLRPLIEKAMQDVLAHGQYVLGPEVVALEDELSSRFGVAHTVTCASGTDALILLLLAVGIGDGDAVFVPSFTFSATAEAVAVAGATPVFVDVDAATFTMSAESLEAAVPVALSSGVTPRAVVAVDLFGHPAAYDALATVADAHGLVLLGDAAQSLGARWRGEASVAVPVAAATSFFPSKPLGCYGDGGAILTSSDELAALARSLRTHGEGASRHENLRIGRNSRLDTLQAAVLLAKLTAFDDERARRADIAARYSTCLDEGVITPAVHPEAEPAWALYTIRVPARARFVERMAAGGIATAVYYPRPLHLQPAYARFPRAADLGVSERLAAEVVSIPAHADLRETEQDRVIEAVMAALTAPH